MTDEVPEVVDAAPVVRVVAGHPTPEELAALLTVLAAVGGGDAGDVGTTAPSRWSAPSGRLRTAYGPGSGAWRASGMPR
ncbi:acyl-CoA carboxylase epsilon subunit [Lapillicoccus sp.]|uniref:acyl-CoA carboxylase epsilon subunit n=1 Tax=Lapillicoccus sp. TaxID=1909287 RepID=UPI0025E69FE6|nr:acyl-CoA carboxylase epsilon subunit [Lapillicoccus sp.]